MAALLEVEEHSLAASATMVVVFSTFFYCKWKESNQLIHSVYWFIVALHIYYSSLVKEKQMSIKCSCCCSHYVTLRASNSDVLRWKCCRNVTRFKLIRLPSWLGCLVRHWSVRHYKTGSGKQWNLLPYKWWNSWEISLGNSLWDVGLSIPGTFNGHSKTENTCFPSSHFSQLTTVVSNKKQCKHFHSFLKLSCHVWIKVGNGLHDEKSCCASLQ